MNFKFFLSSLLVSTLAFASYELCNSLQLDKNLQAKSFRHSRNDALTWFKFHHSASDSITVTGHGAELHAKFTYGPIGKDLEDEDVDLWLDTCGDKLVYLGSYTTDSDGRIHAKLEASQLPNLGAFKVWARVTGDNTFANFTLRILEKGSKLAVFDIDGTLTLSNLNQNIRPGAVEATHLFKDSNLEIVYLSGRHYILTNNSRHLLRDNGFAEGTLIIGQSIPDIVPCDSCVGEFKAGQLASLKKMGLVIDRAYGNAGSDIFAYRQAGIPGSNIFILGEEGGKEGSIALGEDFLGHLNAILAMK